MRKILPLVLLASAASAFAQGVSSLPIGFNSYALPAAPTLNIGIPMYREPIFIGTVSMGAVSGTAPKPQNQIDLPGADFLTNSLANPSKRHFLMVTGGTGAVPFGQQGRSLLITGNTLVSTHPPITRLTLDITDNGPAKSREIPLNFSTTSGTTTHTYVVGNGSTVQIVPAHTLKTFFGSTASNLQLVKGANSFFNADTVAVFDSHSSSFISFYFNLASGTWRKSLGNKDYGDTILFPDTLMAIERKNPTRTAGGITGIVPQVTPLLRIHQPKIPANLTKTFSGFRMPVPFLLNNLADGNIVGLSAGKKVSGNNPASSVELLASNPRNSQIYFISSSTNNPNNNWYVANGSGGTPLTSNVVVSPTQGVLFSIATVPPFPYLYSLYSPYQIVPFDQPITQ